MFRRKKKSQNKEEFDVTKTANFILSLDLQNKVLKRALKSLAKKYTGKDIKSIWINGMKIDL